MLEFHPDGVGAETLLPSSKLRALRSNPKVGAYAGMRRLVMTQKVSLFGNFKNFTRLMTLKASPLGNFKSFARLMTLKVSLLGNRGV